MRKLFLASLLAAITAVSLYSTPALAADTDNFKITQYQADYYLGGDSEGRATLKTVEKIVADFPDSDQNHGLERAIPKNYEGHSTSLKIESVTNGKGEAVEYDDDTSGGNLIIRAGDPDEYVHGQQTYIITYTQRDVTRYFADTGKDEFYWDTNGTMWKVPIENMTVRVHLSDAIAPTFKNDMACYQGREGSTDMCVLARSGNTLEATVNTLAPGENVTVALGFGAGTFVGYSQTPFEKFIEAFMKIWVVSLIITSIFAVAIMIYLSMRWTRTHGRTSDKGTIVAEYLPPKDRSVIVAAQIIETTGSSLTAQLIDLAVRHYIKIIQTKEKSTWKQAEYDIEIVKDVSALAPEERQLLADMFGRQPKVGDRFEMKKMANNYKMGRLIDASINSVKESIKADMKLRERNPGQQKSFTKWGWWILVVAVITLSPLMLVASIVAFICASTLWPYTDEGLKLRKYLEGLKMYIGVAETDRLKMLQSPEGAEKVGTGAADSNEQIVKLYEKVLPYAVLFGQEKEWNKQLGARYEATGSNPDWYSGNAVFNAAIFSSAMSGFTTQASYASSASSGAGGSSGGGASGGGGGGGGGGGW